jgi:hypothetical protein
MRLLALLLLLQGASAQSAAQRLSFQAPFTNHNVKGERVVPFYEVEGDADCGQNYLRVVPDIPNTKGVVRGRIALDAVDFSLSTKFRVSGASERGTGESFGIFISAAHPSPNLESTELFGFGSSFIGVGVIVDTKREGRQNQQWRHRDVTVIANDGTRTSDDMMLNLAGCNGAIRLWEGRDDFNPLQASRIRLRHEGGSVMVEIDSRNSGRWRTCATISDLNMPQGWATTAVVSLVGVNGEGSNNVDVLNVKLYDTARGAWNAEYEDDDDEDNLLVGLAHHIEHELFGIDQGLRETVKALRVREVHAQERIEHLEESLRAGLTSELELRIDLLEEVMFSAIHYSMERDLDAAEQGMHTRIQRDALRMSDQLRSGHSWQTPFYSLAGLIGALCLISSVKFRELKKTHLL